MCIIIKHRKVVFVVYVHLKELRESLGMTQAEFGKSIGIAKSTYNNYETGAREPRADFWVAVAQKYHVTIDYLMGYSDDPHGTVAGTPKAPSAIDLRLEEISKAEHLLNSLVDQSGGSQETDELVKIIHSMSREDKDSLFEAFITIIRALQGGLATVGKPPSDGPQASPIPQEGKDTTPTADAPPEDE